MTKNDKIGLGLMGGALVAMVGLVAGARHKASRPAGALEAGAGGPIFLRGMPHGGQAYLDRQPVSGSWADDAMTLWAIPASPGPHEVRVVLGKYDRSSSVDVQPGMPLWVEVNSDGLWPQAQPTMPPRNPGRTEPPAFAGTFGPTTAAPQDPRRSGTRPPSEPWQIGGVTTAAPQDPRGAYTAPPQDPRGAYTAPPQDPRAPMTAPPQDPGTNAKTPRRPVKGVRPLDWMMGRF